MGRQVSRQQRRAQARRQVGKSPGRRIGWPTIVAAAVIAGIVALLGTQVFGKGGNGSTPSAQTAPTVDGIKCAPVEGTAYHVHTHLTLLDKGRPIGVPAQIGIGAGCLYWIHTHDPNGVLHIEAPTSVKPTLKSFFDIWGVTLSRHQLADVKVKRGQVLKAYVNLKPYHGDPRAIPLGKHTLITLEVGPPFRPPQKFDFGQL